MRGSFKSLSALHCDCDFVPWQCFHQAHQYSRAPEITVTLENTSSEAGLRKHLKKKNSKMPVFDLRIGHKSRRHKRNSNALRWIFVYGTEVRSFPV